MAFKKTEAKNKKTKQAGSDKKVSTILINS